tara:strand:- start:26860 stop:27525 length:666 start_codon:yes stop_codon:yes gene_type:complete
MFNFGNQQPQQSGFNLSQTGGGSISQITTGTGAQNGFSLGAQQQQQSNPFMSGMMGGMGMTPQQQMMMQNGQFAPPSEMELLSALLQSQNPIHRFIRDGGLQTLIELVAATTSLSLLNILKNASFSLDEDTGVMKLDPATLPSDLQTLSAENVSMILNNMTAQSNQKFQEAEMQRQQIMAMSQQSMMGGALAAAMADEGTMQKVGSGIGSVARGLIGLPRN